MLVRIMIVIVMIIICEFPTALRSRCRVLWSEKDELLLSYLRIGCTAWSAGEQGGASHHLPRIVEAL